VPLLQPTSTPLLDHLRTQGRSGGRARNKGESSSSANTPRGATTSSVNKASERSQPAFADNSKASTLPVNGRDTKSARQAANEAGDGSKRDKGKKKRAGSPAKVDISQTQSGIKQGKTPGPPGPPPNQRPRTPVVNAPIPLRQTATGHQSISTATPDLSVRGSKSVEQNQSQSSARDGQGRGGRANGGMGGDGRGRTRAGRGGSNGNTNSEGVASPQMQESRVLPGNVQPPTRGRGGARGGGERTPQKAIIKILSRNAGAPAVNGSAPSIGRESQSSVVPPSQARIDM
jgi:hypothetical protein